MTASFSNHVTEASRLVPTEQVMVKVEEAVCVSAGNLTCLCTYNIVSTEVGNEFEFYNILQVYKLE